ncbi:hypothetical protein [Vibrio sp. WXL103]|uniref:hypothetical protein n=1 Tax=Vibrio sp. WXL103 TaxID=3450710 RepID=UPI003EC50504
MMYYIIEPEVSGWLGPSTSLDKTQHPPSVNNLEIVVDCWLGDSIIESFPCFLVTEDLANNIQKLNASGYQLDTAKIKVDEDYVERKVPAFKWLKITGQAKKDDFGLSNNFRLVVSERVLSLMQSHGLNNADIEIA